MNSVSNPTIVPPDDFSISLVQVAGKKVEFDAQTGVLRFDNRAYTVKVIRNEKELQLSDTDRKEIAKICAEILNRQAEEQLQSMNDLSDVKITKEKIELGPGKQEVKVPDPQLMNRINDIANRSIILPAKKEEAKINPDSPEGLKIQQNKLKDQLIKLNAREMQVKRVLAKIQEPEDNAGTDKFEKYIKDKEKINQELTKLNEARIEIQDKISKINEDLSYL